MLNVHSIYRQTIRAIEGNESLKNIVDIERIKDDLVIEVDNMLNSIFVNLAPIYPQAPISGGTPRMREAITLVDRSYDDKNDFIFANHIKISDYLSFKKMNVRGRE